LRAINVGGHSVKMEYLRQLFELFGFMDVQTYIASGNVVFSSTTSDTIMLETKIQDGLYQALGYQVAAFLRSGDVLAAIADYPAFSETDLSVARVFNIAFLSDIPDTVSQQRLMALQSDIDRFHVHGRQVYWLCRKLQSESSFSNAVLEKTLGQPSTLRTLNTIKKMVQKYQI
jgi:uncharacterized protein (DUF1697 family)